MAGDACRPRSKLRLRHCLDGLREDFLQMAHLLERDDWLAN
jgi:hypothetical protein